METNRLIPDDPNKCPLRLQVLRELTGITTEHKVAPLKKDAVNLKELREERKKEYQKAYYQANKKGQVQEQTDTSQAIKLLDYCKKQKCTSSEAMKHGHVYWENNVAMIQLKQTN